MSSCLYSHPWYCSASLLSVKEWTTTPKILRFWPQVSVDRNRFSYSAQLYNYHKKEKAPLFSGTLSIPSGAVNANASSSVVLPQACPPQIGNNKLQTTGCLKNLAGQGGCLLLWYGPWIEMMNRVRWWSYCQISDILVIVQVLKRFCLFMQVHIYRLRRNELCFNSIRFRNFIPRLNVPQRGKVRWCHEYIWFLT